jgi:hypothetical protein
LSPVSLSVAIPGFFIKLPGLITSEKMRDIYFNWEPPSIPEYIAFAYKGENFLSAKMYNNSSIIEAATKKGRTNLLMQHILDDPKQWFIHYQADFYIPGSGGFGKRCMALTPQLFKKPPEKNDGGISVAELGQQRKRKCCVML